MQGYKVLVVEQDAALRLGLRHSLERLGYSVVESGTGAAALTHAEADGPSLILLNLALPDGDGLEVAEALRRGPRTSGIPIILLTAERVVGQRAERMAKISAGTIPISKPVMVDRLEMDIRLLLSLVRGRVPRRFRRYLVEIPALCRRGDEEYSPGIVRSLSEGGLAIELPTPVPAASLAHLRLQVPGGEVHAAGKVVYSYFEGDKEAESGAYMHGVQFTEMDPQIFARLKPLLQNPGPTSL